MQYGPKNYGITIITLQANAWTHPTPTRERPPLGGRSRHPDQGRRYGRIRSDGFATARTCGWHGY